MSSEEYFIGVDCGTGSVRAGLVSSNGKLICSHSEAIDIYNPQPDFYEQSSDNIWHKTCIAVAHVIENCQIDNIADKVRGIGFDATCSLVVIGDKNVPLSVSPTDKPSHNIILWMDHRAIAQTQYLNSIASQNVDKYGDILSFVGGKIAAEHEIPKILWLKQSKPDTYQSAKYFMDLTDFLSFKATQNDVRSMCTLTCKWLFRSDLVSASSGGDEDAKNNKQPVQFYDSRPGWNDAFFSDIGLSDIVQDNYKKFGVKVGHLGGSIDDGLCAQAAREMRLKPGTAVSIGMIDAHCGAIGLLGANDIEYFEQHKIDMTQRMALICGTSTCHMVPTASKTFVSGIWGPYKNSVAPHAWLLEGGQSSTGSLIDYVIRSFACYPQIQQNASAQNVNVYRYLNERVRQLAAAAAAESETDKGVWSAVSHLTRDLHINPYFHGNRSPLNDASLKGMMVGCKLNDFQDVNQCALYYLATLQALCYDSKSIFETLMQHGVQLKCVFATGGLAKNPLFVQLHADITQLPIVLPQCEDSVLIGGAVLALVASKKGALSFTQAMSQMNHAKTIIHPTADENTIEFHRRKNRVFQKMIADFNEYQNIMQQRATMTAKI